jgi:hypothetical protein
MEKSRNSTIIQRRYAFVFVVLITGTLLGVNFFNRYQSEMQNWDHISSHELGNFKADFDFHISQSITQLLILQNSWELNQLINTAENSSDYEIKRNLLEFLFINISNNFDVFAQIRFLNTSGYEKVRVDNHGVVNSAYTVSILQNKSSRYYYQEIKELDEDQIYISPPDLNRENGSLQIPHLPVVRIGTPLFSNNDDMKGMLIINVNLDHVLSFFPEQIVFGSLSLVDEEGYYIINPDSVGNIWGQPVNLNKSEWNILNKFPNLYEFLNNGVNPTLYKQGLFSSRFMVLKLNFGVTVNSSSWYIISIAEFKDVFLALNNYLLIEIITLSVLWVLALFFMRFLMKNLIKNISKRLEVEKEIKVLQGILPICSYCKKIREEDGSWVQMEWYVHQHSEADFTHSICEQCFEEHFSDL